MRLGSGTGAVNPRLLFVLRRLLLTMPILLVMSVCVFLMLRLIPGDPVRSMLGLRATPENVATLRPSWAWTGRCWTSTSTWLTDLLRGDLGQDIISHAPLTELLGQRLPVTLELTLLGVLVAPASSASRWALSPPSARDGPVC